jgi:hypothetical protein
MVSECAVERADVLAGTHSEHTDDVRRCGAEYVMLEQVFWALQLVQYVPPGNHYTPLLCARTSSDVRHAAL